MPGSNELPVLRYDTILVSERGITEVQGRKAVVFVPADEIKGIALRYGRAEHRPIFSVTLGIMLAAAGLFGLVDFFLASAGWRYELALMALGVIGVSLIFDALKQRHFLEVERAQGVSRLIFSKQAQRAEIQGFCAKLQNVHQYAVVCEI